MNSHDISKSFFQDIYDISSCIHHLLPPPRDTSVLSRLRTVTPLPRLTSRSKKHCSFIIHASNNYHKLPATNHKFNHPYIVIFCIIFCCFNMFSTTVLYLSIRLLLVTGLNKPHCYCHCQQQMQYDTTRYKSLMWTEKLK